MSSRDLVGLQHRTGNSVGVRFERRGGDGLVHDGERCRAWTRRRLRQQGQGGVFGGYFFGDRDGLELGEDVVELDGVEAEVLAAGADGLGNALRSVVAIMR